MGSTGTTVLGVMGEATKLDGAEAVEVAVRFVRRAEGLPVGVGVSAPDFAAMRGLVRASMDAGAARVMLAPPNTLRTDDQIAGYSRRPPRRGLLQHGRGSGGAARRPLPRPAHSGAERWAAARDVPTLRELGVDAQGGAQRGIVGPPEPIRERLVRP